MDFSRFYSELMDFEKTHQKGAYSKLELKTHFHQLKTKDMIHLVEKAIEKELMAEVVPDFWSLTESETPIYKRFAPLLAFLRPNELNYISLESALSQDGIISQIPFVASVSTTGESGWYDTIISRLELCHTEEIREDIEKELIFYSGYGVYYASPALAYRELKRLNRNLDLIDYEELDLEGVER